MLTGSWRLRALGRYARREPNLSRPKAHISYKGMNRTYSQLGEPGIFRNDRFWLAGDHVYDPRNKDQPNVKRLFDGAEKAKKVFKMTEYQGMNVCPVRAQAHGLC